MPIRAILHGHSNVQVPVSEGDWDALKRMSRSDAAALVLPCCGARAVPKKSKRGTQHFAHFRHGECDWEPESQEHLSAKFEIIDGITRAGWKAKPEHTGQNWRADVAAESEGNFKAFEVQWSSQTLERSVERQKLYDLSAVPAYWFFRKLPKKPTAAGNWPDSEFDGDFTTEGLPFFELEQRQHGFIVRFNRRARALRLSRLAELATKGSFAWRPAVTVRSMRVYFHSMVSECFRCGGDVRSVGINWVRYRTGCGFGVDAFRHEQQVMVPKKHFTMVEKFLATDVGQSLGCELELWNRKGEGERGWYRCPHCHVLAVSYIPLMHRERDYGVDVEMKERTFSVPHWCIGGGHGLCSDATNAPGPEAWLGD